MPRRCHALIAILVLLLAACGGSGPGAGAVSGMPPLVGPAPRRGPANLGIVEQLTDNAYDDTWGANNNWPTLGLDTLIYHTDENGEQVVRIADHQGVVLYERNLGVQDVDFLAMGTGANGQGDLYAYRIGLQTSIVGYAAGLEFDLGEQFQEEQSIADGVYVYRNSRNDVVGDNDVAAFEGMGPARILSPAGGNDAYPVTSGNETAFLRDGDLVFTDGSATLLVAPGPFLDRRSFDHRDGIVVYSKDGDLFVVDTTVRPLVAQAITTDGSSTLDTDPRTDGRCVTWIRDGVHVELFDLLTLGATRISTETSPKRGPSLAIDQGQVIYLDGAGTLYFYDGSGSAAGTRTVNPAPAIEVIEPHLLNGKVVWHGRAAGEGDSEIFLMR